MTNVDIQELANASGFGKAKRALKEAGAWDEDAGKPNQKYFVKVEEFYAVEARSRSEAIRKAEQASPEFGEYDVKKQQECDQ
ncbi:hypothetical protein [Pseudovibrio sp. SPO723]|uniref:hypothetical protein n=1 Tax=Nesiotobacter zosterae TaxID=392721 RepID=UPI0029C5BA7D|nr:hypothetical protein [Pseudovibrio sp. SPO723]MDX5592532.1 hypothetical protein [Pseudovibrio sp. SPO723]